MVQHVSTKVKGQSQCRTADSGTFLQQAIIEVHMVVFGGTVIQLVPRASL